MSLLSGIQAFSQRIYTGLQRTYSPAGQSPAPQAQPPNNTDTILPIDIILKNPCQCGGGGGPLPCPKLLKIAVQTLADLREGRLDRAKVGLDFIASQTSGNAQRDGSKITLEDLKLIHDAFRRIEVDFKLNLSNAVTKLDATVSEIEAKANQAIPTGQP